jgi:hypothetical protein
VILAEFRAYLLKKFGTGTMHIPAAKKKNGLILDRLHNLVLAPSDSKGSTLDPGTVAHEHHSYFFPDNGHGAANAAGFGWRNGG